VGISSSQHILRFWGLAGSSVAVEREAAVPKRRLVPAEAESSEIPALAARDSASGGKEREESAPGGWRRHDPRPVIEAALKAAGLLSEAGAGASNPLDPRQIVTGTLRAVGLLRR
jgi:hypothetical protein